MTGILVRGLPCIVACDVEWLVQRIYSIAELDTFVDHARDNAWLGPSVKELTIDIDGPFAPEALRQCLSFTRNLTDLTLFLDDVPIDLLRDIQLQRLEFFNTNLPHRHLPLFLYAHTRMTELCLGPCQRGVETCPLQFLHQRRYLSVECPSECVTQITHPRLLRLTVQDARDLCPSVSIVFGALHPPLTKLSHSTLR